MSHYYTRDGELVAEVPNASRPGSMRPTSVTDAKKLDLIASVTTKLSVLSDVGLDTWKIKNALRESLNYVMLPGMMLDESMFGDIIAIADQKYREEPADYGTVIHDLIRCIYLEQESTYLVTPLQIDIAEAAVKWMDDNDFKMEEVEKTFVSQKYNVAGTVDFKGWVDDIPCIVDYKTEDAEVLRDVTKDKKVIARGFHYYDKFPLQLAGYDLGLEDGVDRKLISMKISRLVPGLVDIKDYTKEKKRWHKRWELLNDYWNDRYMPVEGKAEKLQGEMF